MLQLLMAPPRSGKTYFAVNYLCKFTKYDALYNEYTLLPNVLVISNIEGLKINHWKLSECLKKMPMEEFFSIENFEKIMEKTGKNHVILAIDECHDYFPTGYKNDKIYSFFAFHGHIGLDIILMCQDLAMTSRMFNPLLEFIVKVTPRSRAVLNNFSYSYVSVSGTYLYSKTLTKKPLVFGAYKSFRVDEQQKPKNAVKHWAILTVVIFAVAFLCFKSALAIVKGKSERAKPKPPVVDLSPGVKPVPAVPSASLPAAAASAPSAVMSAGVSSSFHAMSTVKASVSLPSGSYTGRDGSSVVGFMSRSGGRHYLLLDGRIVSCKRSLSVGDIYHP